MKYGIILLITAFTFLDCRAQVPANPYSSFQNLIKVGTTSPEAASIGKFGNVPVSYFTGVPGVSIPVYEINIGKTRLPISLDYQAGGIKMS